MFRHVSIALLLALTLLGVNFIASPHSVLAGANLVVNTTRDKDDANDGLCALREAIFAANHDQDYHGCHGSNMGKDTITFSIPATDPGCAAPNVCTIKLRGPLPEIQSKIIIDGSGKNITLNGFGRQFLKIYLDNALTLKYLTIADGYCGCEGGAISNPQGTLNIFNSTFVNNGANDDWGGGAIYNHGTANIQDSVFTKNRAGHGGSIVNYGTMVIRNSTFTENYASERGGAIANSGNLTVINSTFTRNSSPNGGAMSTNANTDVRSSTFARNNATNGGAIFVAGNTFALTNSTLWNNTAGQMGGAIMNGDISNPNPANLIIINGTLVNNSAAELGSAILNTNAFTLRNTVIASAAKVRNCYSFGRSMTIDKYNLSDDTSCGSATIKTVAQLNLGPLADNGGPTKTLMPGATSAVYDAGDNGVCQAAIGAPNYGAGAVDQRGEPRFNGKCDVGAVEQ